MIANLAYVVSVADLGGWGDRSVPTVVANANDRKVVYAVIALEVSDSILRAVVARNFEDGVNARFYSGEFDTRDSAFAPDLYGVNEYTDAQEAWNSAEARTR